jgi:diguanylate cyclase (GGDEF)-like protein
MADAEETAALARASVRYAVEALAVDGAAIVEDGRVLDAEGVDPDAADPELLERLGAVTTALIRPDLALVVWRATGDPADADSVAAYARLLGTLARLWTGAGESERTQLFASLRSRERLLEQLAAIQRTITHRVPLQEVLDTIVKGAAALFEADVVNLRLLDPNDPETLVMAATHGLDIEFERATRRSSVHEGASGQAVREQRLVVVEDYRARENRSRIARASSESALAVPLHEHGTVIGSMMVGSERPGRRFDPGDGELLVAYAEQASLALAAARTVDGMRQAFRDSLTGLPNRALFLDRLEQALVRADRVGTEATVLFLDLDRFKPVNDSLGHLVGDRLLVDVAGRIESCLRRGDTAARLGGDEFAVLLGGDDCGADEAAAVAERIIHAISQPFHLPEGEIYLGVSIGMASGRDEAEELLRNADMAMYRAKSRGRGCYAAYERGMRAAIVSRLEVEADLRRAIERGELELHYQPVVELATTRIRGLEALLRWSHPKRGLVSPGEFLPVAEETGLIVPIGRWVLRQACADLVGWHAVDPELVLSVNLSVRQLRRSDLLDDVITALAAGIDPSKLVLELTESELLRESEAGNEMLAALRRLGVRLAIDDFGTGYSSLQYLTRIPADVLKVAKPFVEGLGRGGPADMAVARTVLALGDALGIPTVAEGIETAEELERLLELGCELGQGFALARPRPAAGVPELLGSTARAA